MNKFSTYLHTKVINMFNDSITMLFLDKELTQGHEYCIKYTTFA